MKPRLLLLVRVTSGAILMSERSMKMAEIIAKIVLVIVLIAEHLKGGKPNA